MREGESMKKILAFGLFIFMFVILAQQSSKALALHAPKVSPTPTPDVASPTPTPGFGYPTPVVTKPVDGCGGAPECNPQ